MTRNITIATLLVILAARPVPADNRVDTEVKTDVVLRALVDELQRSKDRLKLEGLKTPYFLEYSLSDSASAMVSAKLGAITGRSEGRNRMLRTDIRVGDYTLDNTNFQGDFGGFSFGGASIPIEDDYAAIRQAIWWSTDRQYKTVTENFERKKAFMESKMIDDKPDDFSKEKSNVFFEERIQPDLDPADLEKVAVPLSEIFRSYPDVQSSGVSYSAVGGNKYLVNTEGTRIRQSGYRYTLSVSATVQADDGMKLSDSFTAYATKLDEMPSQDELAKRTRDMAEALLKLKAAPKLESYTGPVLFDARPAAQVFSQQFATRFCGGQRPVGGQASPEDFEKKIGEKILPKFLSVVDDPTKEKLDDEPVMGHYEYDDQGVKAGPVTLIDDGKLKSLVMSRNPSKKFKNSTGHGRGAFRPTTSTSCLIVSADEGEDDAALKKQLLEACKEEGLEYGIRVGSLGTAGATGDFSRFAEMFGGMSFDFGGMRGGGTTPLTMYRVFPDGKEELVRGAEISRMDLKSFKKIQAAGDKNYVLNTAGGGAAGRTVAAPAMLFEELDFAEIDRDFDKPPIIETPLARK